MNAPETADHAYESEILAAVEHLQREMVELRRPVRLMARWRGVEKA